VLLALGEDDRVQALADHLRGSGLDVTVVEPGALGAARQRGAVDVVVATPAAGADGPALVDAARALGPDLEIILAASPDRLAEAVGWLRAGASDLLPFPPAAPALLDAVDRALERSRARGLARELLRVAREASLGQLTGGIVHEVANPLAVLNASTEGISDDLGALAALPAMLEQEDAAGPVASWWARDGRRTVEQIREIVGEAGEAVTRLKALTRDLRSIVRADPEARVQCDAADALEAALRVARGELSVVRVSADAPKGILVKASPGALAQALLHLLVRAAHAIVATPERRGRIAVRASRDGAYALLAVEDDVERPQEDPLARLLAPRLPEGAPRAGSALGLVVARELVERQGGTLRARPREGGGTVFELRIPLAPT
jgi:signal transduction histidine kinase